MTYSGGEQPLVDRRGDPALEQNGQLRLSRAPEQGKILHVARADLDHIGIFFHEIDTSFVERLGDNLQAEGVASFRENLETFFA